MENIHAIAASNFNKLKASDYPGRGIVLGLTPSGKEAVQIYWTNGRSESSKNRVLVKQDGCVKAMLFDPAKKMEREDLRTYNGAMRVGNAYIVSNGRQTDTVAEYIAKGDAFENAMYQWSFEDDPMCTPRITGLTAVDPKTCAFEFKLSVIKAVDQNPALLSHQSFRYKDCVPGYGWCVHTYNLMETCFPFGGEPYWVPVAEDIGENAETYWNALSPDKRVGLYVRHISLATGNAVDTIRNQL